MIKKDRFVLQKKLGNISTLIDQVKIKERVEQLGKQISEHFCGEEITVVCILKGSFMFCADLFPLPFWSQDFV